MSYVGSDLAADQAAIIRLRQLQSQARVMQMESMTQQLNGETAAIYQSMGDGLTPEQRLITQVRQMESQQRILQMQGVSGQDRGIPQARLIGNQLAGGWEAVMGRLPDYQNGPATYDRLFGNRPFADNLGNSQGGRAALGFGLGALQGVPEAEALRNSMQKGLEGGNFGGGDIKKLQEFLQKNGFDVGAGGVDGKFGPDTHKALMQYVSVRDAQKFDNQWDMMKKLRGGQGQRSEGPVLEQAVWRNTNPRPEIRDALWRSTDPKPQVLLA